MPIIECALEPSETELERVSIEVDRHSLQKCRWRRSAMDGLDFAFALSEPLRHGDYVFESRIKRYQIDQLPEPVFGIALPATPPEAAKLAWTLGNLHQPIEVREERILVAEDPGIRRLLDELDHAYEELCEIFAPPAHSAAHLHDPATWPGGHHPHALFGHSHAPSL